ncbi:hypothetical protein [Pseudomonas sp. PL-6]
MGLEDFSCDLELIGNTLFCKVGGVGDYIFAYYVYFNGGVICKTGYTKDSQFLFECVGAGRYFVTAFFKDKQGQRFSSASRSVFLFKQQPLSEVGISDCAVKSSVGGWDFYWLFYPARKRENKLFVLLSGAIDREKTAPPVFNRYSWAEKGVFPGGVLVISDPSVSLDGCLDLGWYIGDVDGGVSEGVCDIVRFYLRLLGLTIEDVVFWGSSGGGFAAISASIKMPGSKAVAINAQANILRYEVRRSVDKFLDFIGVSRLGSEVENNPEINLLVRNMATGRILLAQNVFDRHHLECHFSNMLCHLRRCGALFKVYMIVDERGHVGETVEDALNIIGEVLEL